MCKEHLILSLIVFLAMLSWTVSQYNSAATTDWYEFSDLQSGGQLNTGNQLAVDGTGNSIHQTQPPQQTQEQLGPTTQDSFEEQKQFDLSYDFKKEMCRERTIRLNWELLLEPCKNNLEFSRSIFSTTDRTNAKNSRIINKRIRNAGEYSGFTIQTFDNTSSPKKMGGDSIRVFINGTAFIESVVYDMNDGHYETSFLLMEPGLYVVDVILDGSLCSSAVNPPPDWFRKGTNIIFKLNFHL